MEYVLQSKLKEGLVKYFSSIPVLWSIYFLPHYCYHMRKIVRLFVHACLPLERRKMIFLSNWFFYATPTRTTYSVCFFSFHLVLIVVFFPALISPPSPPVLLPTRNKWVWNQFFLFFHSPPSSFFPGLSWTVWWCRSRTRLRIGRKLPPLSTRSMQKVGSSLLSWFIGFGGPWTVSENVGFEKEGLTKTRPSSFLRFSRK